MGAFLLRRFPLFWMTILCPGVGDSCSWDDQTHREKHGHPNEEGADLHYTRTKVSVPGLRTTTCWVSSIWMAPQQLCVVSLNSKIHIDNDAYCRVSNVGSKKRYLYIPFLEPQ